MRRFYIVLLAIVCLVFLFDACAKKQPVKTGPEREGADVEKVEEGTPRIDKPTLSEEELFEKQDLGEMNRQEYLKTVYFDFDKYFIRDDMKPNLQRNADWMLKFPSVIVSVEGHCDERGTIEYNMALGERRAKAARDYLVSLGVPSIRLQTISYGKSKPLVKDAAAEDEHANNRRAEFVIIKK